MKAIVAHDKNLGIGINDKLPWFFKKELAWFKMATLNHTIIMGRKTFDSLPGILPGRKHVVITSNQLESTENVEFMSFEEALETYQNDEYCFVIGGATIYKLFSPYIKKMFVTEINGEYECDTFLTFNKNWLDKSLILKDDDFSVYLYTYTR